MKNIFRILAVCLTLMVVFTSLTACRSKKDTETLSDPVSSQTVTVSDTESEDTSSVSEDSASSEPQPTVSSAPQASSQTQTPTVTTPSKVETASQSEPAKQPEPVPEPEPEPAAKTPQELLIGKWSSSYDCSSNLAELGYTDLGPCVINATVEFTTSGSYIAMVDGDSMVQILRPVLQKSINDTMLEQGMTEQQFIDEIGMTPTEYVEYYVSMFSEGINEVTSYKFEGDTLYIKDTSTGEFYEAPYSFIDDNNFSLTEMGDSLFYTRVQ